MVIAVAGSMRGFHRRNQSYNPSGNFIVVDDKAGTIGAESPLD
jgi:hypothetical protein